MRPQASPPANSNSSDIQSEQSETNTQKTIFLTKKKKFLFILLGIIFFLLTTSTINLRKSQIQTFQPPISTPSPIYKTQEECERKTGTFCVFQNCDYIQEGKTFEEVCGKKFQKGWVPTDNPTIQTDTSNWKTYRNEEYGFEVKYSNDYFITELKKGGITIAHNKWIEGLVHHPYIAIQIVKTELTIDAWIEDQINESVDDGYGLIEENCSLHCISRKAQEITVGNNIRALRYRMWGASGGNENTVVKKDTSSNWLIEIANHTAGSRDPGETNVPRDVLNQILSTFKFIDEAESEQTVKLYYHDSNLDPETLDCQANNYLEKSLPPTKTPIKDTINLLIDSGMLFNPPEFKLLSSNLKEGILYLEFPWIPSYTTGGSCHIGILTSQIIDTAIQFSEVEKVTFKPDVFQP